MKRILIIGSQHGNERLGERLYRHVRKYEPDLAPFLTFLIANPLARSKGTRFIETDMNRSYRGGLGSYEEYLARALLAHIEHASYDIVLDMHTTRCAQPSSILIAPDSKVDNFIAASTIQNIVIMEPHLAKTSLIGNVKNCVSIEMQERRVTKLTLNELAGDIKRYINGSTYETTRKKYVIDDLLHKVELSQEDVQRLRNFQKSKHGFYPILVGNNSYRKNTHYLGFKAHLVSDTSIPKVGYNEHQ